MKIKHLFFVGALLFSVPLALTSCSDDDDNEIPKTEIEKQKEALVTAMESDAALSTFAEAFKTLDLSGITADKLTILAVKNNGLVTRAGMTTEQLNRHIIEGAYDNTTLAQQTEVKSLGGTKLVVSLDSDGGILLNNQPVGKASTVGNSVLYVLDEPVPADNNSIKLQEEYDTSRCRVTVLEAETTGLEGAEFQWVLSEDVQETKLAMIADGTKLQFIAVYDGDYPITFNAVKDGKTLLSASTVVKVASEGKLSAEAATVAEYSPAPGQDITYSGQSGASTTALKIGAFGGYGVVKFDHTIVNVPGLCDFRTKINANVCPCVIWVAYDFNGDGKADEDEWFEIKGSMHGTSVDKGMKTITYLQPEKNPCVGTAPMPWDPNAEEWGLSWELDGESGYLVNTFSGVYWPTWESGSYTRTARLLDWPKDPNSPNGYTNKLSTGWGYAGNYQSFQHNSAAIDIDWAVKADGTPANLPGIDFIKVANSILGNNYMMGEHRASFTGFHDLHLYDNGIEITPEQAKGE